jgi:hypothetical protein
MTVEYLILGVVLVVMGGVQIWLRYGSWAKEQQAAERKRQPAPAMRERGTRVWTTWTAILGPLAIVFGLVLVILGALGL